MQTKQAAGREYIDEWVLEELVKGKPIEDINGITFVIGNELLTVTKKADGSFDVEPQKAKEVIVLQKKIATEFENICTTCGLEHQSYKEVLQCCDDIE